MLVVMDLTMRRAAILTLVLSFLCVARAWDETFQTKNCYLKGLDGFIERMPLSLSNLVALLEDWEEKHSFTAADTEAESIVKRYRKDGMVYTPSSSASKWTQSEEDESKKQQVEDRVLQMSSIVPANSFTPREECALHFTVSHSTDKYPFGGSSWIWENTNTQRKKRQAQSRYALPSDVTASDHPMENGVIFTPSGPVAGGTLLAGLMARDRASVSIRNMYQNELPIVPNEVLDCSLIPLHAATLAGDCAQAVINAMLDPSNSGRSTISPRGLFSNSTAAPKMFTQQTGNNGIVSYMTRSEIYAGIDALLISKYIRSANTRDVRLSQVLRMYYSEHGLPGYPEFRACNRLNLFNSALQNDKTEIAIQTKSLAYALALKYPSLKTMMEEALDVATIDNNLGKYLQAVRTDLNAFISQGGSEDFAACPLYGRTDLKCEGQVDLLVVTGGEVSNVEVTRQKETIAHLAMMIGVSKKRSRIAILDSKKLDWTLPMTNLTNVADYMANYTTELSTYGSYTDMRPILLKLTEYYNNFYNEIRGSATTTKAHSQVVLWYMPGAFNDKDEFLEQLKNFRVRFMDVYFLLIGKSKGTFTEMMIDENKDFFSTTSNSDPYKLAETINKRVCQVPEAFVYPACDPRNATFKGYKETSHIYTGFVTPNFTHYLAITPYYFQYSGYVKLTLNNANVKMCTSRESMEVLDTAQDYTCKENSGDFEFWDLCGRYVINCKAIYISITGSTTAGLSNVCNGVECEYPDQVEFTLRHQGLTCGAMTSFSAPVAVMLTVLAANLFRHW